jgi:Helix-turn-helix domain
MTKGLITMSTKELDRLPIIKLVIDKRLSQVEAAKKLGLSDRQIRRLCAGYLRYGESGIISKKRGSISNRKHSNEFRSNCVNLIKQDFYDYGPTLAAEKLYEYKNLKISKETARQWMISEDVWKVKPRHDITVHQPRYRRSCFGELIQIDGSEHAWFEERGPRCTLLVFIDDATSLVQKLLFVEAETTFGYLRILKDYLKEYGKPMAIYSDKHVVFRVNFPEAKSGNGLTQFGRVLNKLRIESIFANSPQAKGRVERCNGTLQDRLVKELRYRGISDIQSANAFLESFRQDFNRRFAKVPKDIVNMHRFLNEYEWHQLDTLFTIQTPHKVSKSLTVRHKKIIYKIILPGKGHRLRQAGVLVCEDESGKITIIHNNQPLNYEVYKEHMHDGQIMSRKELEVFLNQLMNHMKTRDKIAINDLIEPLGISYRK